MLARGCLPVYGWVMSVDIPTRPDFAELAQHRSAASVTIYISAAGTGSSAIVHDIEAAKVALRSALNDAVAELAEAGLGRVDRDQLLGHGQDLSADLDFWRTGARSIAIFLSPEGLRAFRLMNELDSAWSTGDRFDVGPMLRAITFAHTGYVLVLAAGEVRLLHLDAAATCRPVELTELPEDAASALTRDPAVGRFNRHRADGTQGPKPEQKRYASIVQEAVAAAVSDPDAPLVLAAAQDLDAAYRAANAHPRLLEQGIDANPGSLSDEDLEQRTRAILDEHYAQRIRTWIEEFGTLQAHGRATSQLSEVAREAWSGQVAELLFDISADQEGTIDEYGSIDFAEESGATTYRVVDDIAMQVWNTGGRVRAVRADDLPDDSPVAATLRR